MENGWEWEQSTAFRLTETEEEGIYLLAGPRVGVSIKKDVHLLTMLRIYGAPASVIDELFPEETLEAEVDENFLMDVEGTCSNCGHQELALAVAIVTDLMREQRPIGGYICKHCGHQEQGT